MGDPALIHHVLVVKFSLKRRHKSHKKYARMPVGEQMPRATDGAWRAVIVGGVIAGLGPLFGFAAVVAWILLGRGTGAALYLIQFPDIVITPYLFGGGPAALAGLVAGWRIWRRGAISMPFWLVMTAIFALGPSLPYLALSAPPPNGIQYVTDQEIAAAYIAAVVFASLALRLLLSASGRLRG
jgi:hypothetical protein